MLRRHVPAHHASPWLAACTAAFLCATTAASDAPPAIVTSFTRRVQPLLLNRCAAGACHGGPAAEGLRLHRPDVHGTVDRSMTLANLEALLDALGPELDPQPLVAALAVRHPAAALPRSPVLEPLTARERAALETWVAEVRTTRATAPRPPHATATVDPQRPNRFRNLLQAAANPPQLPPPEEPRGIVLGGDDEPPDP